MVISAGSILLHGVFMVAALREHDHMSVAILVVLAKETSSWDPQEQEDKNNLSWNIMKATLLNLKSTSSALSHALKCACLQLFITLDASV